MLKKNKELELQKEVLIKDHKTTLNLNIATYNKVLKIFGSPFELPSYDKKDDALLTENLETIKSYYYNITKEINAMYIEKLNLCQ